MRALAFLVALPLAAWSAMRVPQAPAKQPSHVAASAAVLVAPRARHVVVRRTAAPRAPDMKTIMLMRAIQLRVAVWDQLAHCESGGNWNVVDRFGGGLGIYVGTWHMFHGDDFASNPGYASKSQQIIVAERIYARYGFTGWGCAHELGWVN